MTDHDDNPFQDVIEHPHGGILFPAVLGTKDAHGVVVEKRVRVRVPRPDDAIEAHVRAVIWFSSKKDREGNRVLDRKLDAEVFEQMEQLCLLAGAIRDWESLAQLEQPEDLAKCEETSLKAIQEQINAYKLVIDHRVEELSDNDFWRTVLQMNRGQTIAPLGGMAGPAQFSFIMRMVSLAANSPEARSYLRPSESSTPER